MKAHFQVAMPKIVLPRKTSNLGTDPIGAPVSGDPIRGILWALAFLAPLWLWLSVWVLT